MHDKIDNEVDRSTIARAMLTVDLEKIRSNYRIIQQAVAPAQVMAVLKANAYGLGLSAVAQSLVTVGVDRIGVASAEEALQLAPLPCPVQIIGAVLPEEIPECIKHDVVIPLADHKTLELVVAAANQLGKRPVVHVLLDTGMGRLGMTAENAAAFLSTVASCNAVTLEGVYSHFPSAYDDSAFSHQQIACFRQIMKTAGVKPQFQHIANSDGINNIPDSFHAPFNLVRSGINLYGYFDTVGAKHLPIEPVIRLEAKLIAVRTLPAGASIGYGRAYRLKQAQRIGTVAIGYADGLPMQLAGSGALGVRGVRCPIVGRVSMDYTTICLDAVPDATPGDLVLCIGPGYTLETWAEKKGTVIYEAICAPGQRVQRRYYGTR